MFDEYKADFKEEQYTDTNPYDDFYFDEAIPADEDNESDTTEWSTRPSLNRISQQYEDDLWLNKVYTKLQNSTNDIPLLRVIKRLRKGTEQQLSPEKPLQTYLDSEIIHDLHSPPDSEDISSNPPYDHLSTGEDDDDPINSSSHKSDTITPSINKTEDSAPAQNDSGANRIVTDNLNLLTNVHVIDPISMGGCNKNDTAAITCTAIGDIVIHSTDGESITFKAYYSETLMGP